MTTHLVTMTKLRYLILTLPQPQYEIAALARIHPSTFSSYCKGTRDIKADHLVALFELLKLEPEEILGWIDVEVKEV